MRFMAPHIADGWEVRGFASRVSIGIVDRNHHLSQVHAHKYEGASHPITIFPDEVDDLVAAGGVILPWIVMTCYYVRRFAA